MHHRLTRINAEGLEYYRTLIFSLALASKIGRWEYRVVRRIRKAIASLGW
jgi:hypothetical protein